MPSEEGRCPTCGFALPFGRKIEVRRDDFDPVEMAARLNAATASVDVLVQQLAEAISEAARRHEASQRAYFEIDAACHAHRTRADREAASSRSACDALMAQMQRTDELLRENAELRKKAE